jgi:tetratricopeptide (TPR) repeat protein
MGQEVTERERAAIGNGFPSSAEAYAEFLRGNRLLAVRTPASVEEALMRYRHATTLDTTFAGAFARQSYAYSLLADWGWKPTKQFTGDPLEEGLALADEATRLDSTSAEAWLSRAYILVRRDPVRFSGAVEAFQHAIALDPYNAEAFHQYGQTLMPLGRYTEALAAYRRAVDLEPERAMTFVPMAAISKRLGRLGEALRLLDTAVARAPRVPYARASRSLTRVQTGDLEGARKDAEFGLALDSTFQMPSLTALVRALWVAGDTALAIARLEQAERLVVNPAAPTPTEAFWLGMAEISAGRNDKAVGLLRNARPRGALLWFMFEAAEMNSFRKIPEVASIMNQIAPVKQ